MLISKKLPQIIAFICLITMIFSLTSCIEQDGCYMKIGNKFISHLYDLSTPDEIIDELENKFNKRKVKKIEYTKVGDVYCLLDYKSMRIPPTNEEFVKVFFKAVVINGDQSKKICIKKTSMVSLDGKVFFESDYEIVETIALARGMEFNEESINKAILICPISNKWFYEGNEILLIVDLDIEGVSTTIKYPISFPKRWSFPWLEIT